MTEKPADIRMIECPRDAMQGWKVFIPTQRKVDYMQQLLKVGFDTIDCGSFVSAKAIPQMEDTKEVLGRLHLDGSRSKLLAIVANVRGAREAADYEIISYLGFPFSVSPTFQKRNINHTIDQSLDDVRAIKSIGEGKGKEPVIYISMAFGNPYQDPFSEELVLQWIEKIVAEGIRIISLADTVGMATPQQVGSLTMAVMEAFPSIDIGLHLHSTAVNWQQKLAVALQAGCRRFDGALKGIGGCPMANDDLVGNMDSALMIPYFEERGYYTSVDRQQLAQSIAMAETIFVA